MKRANALIIAVIVSLAGCSSQNRSGETAHSFDVHIPVRYLLYVPPGYRADPMDAKSGDGHGWPLVLFLHGAGERGDDIEMVKTHGPPKLVAQGMRLPFILVSPQCPKDEWWDPQLLTPLLDEIQRTYKVDPDRVYLTGLSMGGFGTWDMARRHPSRFAAIVPICGGSEPSLVSLFPALKMLPVWAFHGADDKTVPPSRSEEMISALHKLGNSQAGLTIYPGVGHDSWTRTYENPHVYEWMLDQKRGGGSQ